MDSDSETLIRIRNRWESNEAYADKVVTLRNGFNFNGETVKLDTETLRDDVDEDELRGQDGRDWFFADDDRLIDQSSIEFVDVI